MRHVPTGYKEIQGRQGPLLLDGVRHFFQINTDTAGNSSNKLPKGRGARPERLRERCAEVLRRRKSGDFCDALERHRRRLHEPLRLGKPRFGYLFLDGGAQLLPESPVHQRV